MTKIHNNDQAQNGKQLEAAFYSPDRESYTTTGPEYYYQRSKIPNQDSMMDERYGTGDTELP